MRKTMAALTLGLAIAPFTSHAQGLSYDYIEGGIALYPSAGIHNTGSQDYLGIDLRGSLDLRQVAENLFVFGGLKHLTDDIDLTAFHVGGGVHMPIENGTDLWGGLTMEYQKFDFPQAGSSSDTALGLRGGIRHQLNDDLEIGGSLRLVTGDADYLGLTGTMRYQLQGNLQLLGEVDLYDGELGVIGGITMNF